MRINKKIKKANPEIYLFAALIVVASSTIYAPVAFSQTGRNNELHHKYDVAAYIWPSTHNDPLAQKLLWPEGIGEWQIIKKGTPRFPGHYQPKVPLWGYQMGDNPKVMKRWISAATDHGVNVFVFDWYWYDHGPFLEGTLDSGFLKAENNMKMKFYIMWANHNVAKNYWNVYKYKDDHSLLFNGAVGMKDFRRIVKRVINLYFLKPNYYKINGRPVFSIFKLDNFIKGFGGLPAAKDALAYFRSEVKKAGFPGLHIQIIGFGYPTKKKLDDIRYLGVNSVTKYNWGGPIPEDYIKWGTRETEIRKAWDSALTIPYFANVSIGFDDTPRFPDKGKKDIVHFNKSPTSFAAFLQRAKEYAHDHPEQAGLITIYAWNEWVEGSYLLPDVKYGFKYLDAVKNVFNGSFDPYAN